MRGRMAPLPWSRPAPLLLWTLHHPACAYAKRLRACAGTAVPPLSGRHWEHAHCGAGRRRVRGRSGQCGGEVVLHPALSGRDWGCHGAELGFGFVRGILTRAERLMLRALSPAYQQLPMASALGYWPSPAA